MAEHASPIQTAEEYNAAAAHRAAQIVANRGEPAAWRWKHPSEDRWQHGPNHPGFPETSPYVVQPLFL